MRIVADLHANTADVALATFGKSGKSSVTTPFGPDARRIALTTGGQIVVVGEARPGGSVSDTDMVVWRLKASGQLDTTFGTGGVVMHDAAAGMPGSADGARGLAIDGQDRIYVVGQSSNGKNSDLVVWRLRPDGALDPTFNNVGYVVHHSAAGGGGDDVGLAALLHGDKLLVTGASASAKQGLDMTIWRFLLDGRLDPSFNKVGHYSHGESSTDRGHAVAVGDKGRIVVTGERGNGLDQDLAVWCLKQQQL